MRRPWMPAPLNPLTESITSYTIFLEGDVKRAAAERVDVVTDHQHALWLLCAVGREADGGRESSPPGRDVDIGSRIE